MCIFIADLPTLTAIMYAQDIYSHFAIKNTNVF